LQSTQQPSTTSTNQNHLNFSFDVSQLWGQVNTTGMKPWVYWGSSFRFQAWRKCYKSSDGSPLSLFLKNGSWQGLIHGLFDGLTDTYPLVRSLYLAYLQLMLKWSDRQERAVLLEQKIRFLNSPHKSRDRKHERQLLKEFNRRLAARVR
jgi:hypothetical protein